MEKENPVEVFAMLVAVKDSENIPPRDIHGSYSKSTFKGMDRDDAD